MIELPTVGRIVHWYDTNARVPEAALVIATHPDSVDLTVFGGWTGTTRLVVFARPRTGNDEYGWEYPPRV